MPEELEVWRPIYKWGDRYEVSNYGRVRSLDRIDSWGRKFAGKILVQNLDRRGYPRMSLVRDYERWHPRVHRLVAIAFIPNPSNLPQVNHIDTVKTNNHWKNLEWMTNEQNLQHAHENGVMTYHEGAEHHNFLAPIQVFKDGIHIETIYGNKDAKAKGYEMKNISKCLHGTRHTHKGCTYQRNA